MAFFAAGLLGFLLSLLTMMSSMVAMYAPPEVMAQQSARKGLDLIPVATGIAILLLAGIIAYFLGRRNKTPLPPEEKKNP